MARIKIDTTHSGKREYFEGASTHLLTYVPVAKNRSVANIKRGADKIFETIREEVSSFGENEGIRKSGIHLRYQKPEEYKPVSR